MENQLTKKTYDKYDEELIESILPNGLKVIFSKKKGFQKKYATITTPFGSTDHQYYDLNLNELITLPLGVAHFLEHKMFEKKEGDIFKKFSELGANANAFTSFDRTSYLFSCVDHFEENLKLLIDLVQEPYFTHNSIQKEIGIIAEEIKMYQDSPNHKHFFQTLNALYPSHPVKNDIAGTIESIQKINQKILYDIHKYFYHPSQMVLTIVGDVDIHKTIDVLNKHIKQLPIIEDLIEKTIIPHETAIQSQYVEQYAPITQPKIMLALKLDPYRLSTVDKYKREMAMMLALEMIFSERSDFYIENLEQHVIDESFKYGFIEEKTFTYMMISARTKNLDLFKSNVYETIEKFYHNDELFEEKTFTKLKKELIGDFIIGLNSLEYIADQLTKHSFEQLEFYELLDVINELSLKYIVDTFKEVIDEGQFIESVLLPNESKK